MSERRDCPVCGRSVMVNESNGGLRSHFSDKELGMSPSYMRMHCAGSGTLETTYEMTPSHGLVERWGIPLWYGQSPDGWSYHLLIPTGMSPTHRMFEEAEAQAMIAALRASTKMHDEMSTGTLSPETLGDLQVSIAALKRVRREA